MGLLTTDQSKKNRPPFILICLVWVRGWESFHFSFFFFFTAFFTLPAQSSLGFTQNTNPLLRLYSSSPSLFFFLCDVPCSYLQSPWLHTRHLWYQTTVTGPYHSIFYGKILVPSQPTLKLEDHPLSALLDCLFNTFAVTRRPSPLSTAWASAKGLT